MSRIRASADYAITARDRASGTVRNVRRNFAELDGQVKKLTGGLSLAGAASTGIFAQIVRSQAPTIDALGKTADKLGVLTQELQAVRDAGERAGLENKQVDVGLQRMARRIATTSDESSKLGKELTKLGLSYEDLAGLDTIERFKLLSDRINDVSDSGERIRLAFKFFDKEGVDLFKVLSDDVVGARREMERLGISVDRIQAAGVEAMNDELQRTGRFVKGAAQVFTAEMAPAITAVLRTIFDLDGGTRDLKATFRAVVDSGVRAFGLIGDGVNGVRSVVAAFNYGLNEAVYTLSKVRDKIPGLKDVGIDTATAFDGMIRAYEKYAAIPTGSDFSRRLVENLSAARAEAEELARISEQRYLSGQVATPESSTDAARGGEDGRQGEAAQALEALRASLRSETEAVRAAEAEQLNVVRDALAARTVDETEAAALRTRIRAGAASQIAELAAAASREASSERERLASELAGVEGAVATELQRVRSAFAERRAIVARSLAGELITRERAAALRVQLAEKEAGEVLAVQQRAAEEERRAREEATRELDRLATGLTSPAERARTAFDARLEVVRTALDDEHITLERAIELELELERRKYRELARIRARSGGGDEEERSAGFADGGRGERQRRDSTGLPEERAVSRIEELKASLGEETRAIEAAYTARAEMIRSREEQGLIGAREARAAEVALNDRAETDITAAKRREADRRKEISELNYQVARSAGLAILQIAGQQSKKAFKVFKAASKADAVVSAVRGAAKTLGQYGWPLGPLLAAKHLALGYAQVRKIDGMQFEGGGGGAGGISASAGGASAAGGSGTGGSGSGANLRAPESGGAAVAAPEPARPEPRQQVVMNVYAAPGTSESERHRLFLSSMERARKNREVVIDDDAEIIVNHRDVAA